MRSFFNIFGGDKTTKKEGKNESILNWARSAKMGCELAPSTPPAGQELMTVAGGCFWGLELAFQRVPGVTKTSVGYTGGGTPNPTYESVCSGRTGHAEAVQVTYDPKEADFGKLLDVFFERTDPTTLNRQGNDMGTQYRSAIYFHNQDQKAVAESKVASIDQKIAAGDFRCKGGSKPAGNKVVVSLEPAQDYYLAEEYHQQYLSKGGRAGRAQSAAKGCSDPIRCYG